MSINNQISSTQNNLCMESVTNYVNIKSSVYKKNFVTS